MARRRGGLRSRRRGGLLWHRNFRLLWLGETISGAGTAMAATGVPLLAVTVLHASTFAVAALTAAAYLPWLVIGLPAGAWVDRLPVRPLMITCDVISALLYASLPAAAWAGVLTMDQVLAVALLAGAASVFFATAYQVLLPALVSTGELVEGNAKLQGSAAAAAIGGRGAAGLAAEAVGAATALLFNAASFLVSAACLLRIRTGVTPGPSPGPRVTTVRAEVAQGLRFIAGDPYLRPLTLYAAVANLAYTGSTALLVVFLVRVAGFGPAAVGLLFATASVGGVLGAVVARRLARRLGTARAMLLSALAGGLSGLLIPLSGTGPRAACYVAGAAVASGGIAVGNIIGGSFRQAYCPPAMLGRITASMRFLVFGTIPLGALPAGALATALGTRAALWVMLAGYGLSGAFLATPAMLAHRDLPSRSPRPTDQDGQPGTLTSAGTRS
jgi:Transmembrane secretion effector